MTIRRGEQWGAIVARPDSLAIVASDAELHHLLNRSRRKHLAGCSAGLVTGGGDLARTVAASKTAAGLGEATELVRMTIDIGRAEFGVSTVWFACHAVIRRPGWRAWRGALTALMNAQFLGQWDVAPRSHPNDGRIDVVATSAPFGIRQRMQALRRLATGTHLPHPALSESRVRQWQGSVEHGQVLLLDGVPYRYEGPLTITVEPDAMAAYI